MRISYTHYAPFNFLNKTGIRIILNKWDGVGMGVTYPEPAPLPSLIISFYLVLMKTVENELHVLWKITKKKKKKIKIMFGSRNF